MTSASADVLVFRAHFLSFAKVAANDALRAALQTETTPEEIVEFFEWRFDDLICRFSASFDDSCVRIGKPFSDAAREAMCKGPGGSKSYEDA
jgi:hypothetical protein